MLILLCSGLAQSRPVKVQKLRIHTTNHNAVSVLEFLIKTNNVVGAINYLSTTTTPNPIDQYATEGMPLVYLALHLGGEQDVDPFTPPDHKSSMLNVLLYYGANIEMPWNGQTLVGYAYSIGLLLTADQLWDFYYSPEIGRAHV